MADKDEVHVRITGEAASLNAAMRGAADSVKNGVGQMRSSLTSVAQSFRAFSGVLTSVLATGALASLARQSIQLGDDLNKAAIKAGVSGEVISQLAYAAKMADVDLGSLSQSLRFMQKNLSEASSGGKQQLDTLKVLGLTYQQLKVLAPEKQFELIADRINMVKDPADKARAATELFGRAGANLLPLFEQGAAGIRAAREEAERLGASFSGEQLKRLAEADDAIKRLDASWKGFATTITAAVAPGLTRVLHLFDRMVQAAREGKSGIAFYKEIQGEERGRAWVESGQSRDPPGRYVSHDSPTSSYAAVASAAKPLTAEQILSNEAAKPLTAEQILSNEQRVTRGRLGAIRTMQEADETYLNAQVDLQEEAVSRKRGIDLEEVAAREDELRTMADQGRISREQELAGMRQLEDAKYEIERDALAQKVLDISLSEVETQRAYNEFERLAQEHAHRLRAIDLQAAGEQRRIWSFTMQSIGNSLQPVIARFLNMTLTVKGLLVGMASAVANALANVAAQGIANLLILAATGQKLRLKEIMGNARAAAAGAYKAVVGIPYVGPFLAPGAAAVAFGAVAAFASAKGGYDIPANVNPVTQLHAREMVLPAEQADTIRGMGRGGGGTTIHNHINAFDVRSVTQALSRHNDAVGAAMRQYARGRGFNPR